MVSETSKCYTPTSLWNELKKLENGIYDISITKLNDYEIHYVIINPFKKG